MSIVLDGPHPKAVPLTLNGVVRRAWIGIGIFLVMIFGVFALSPISGAVVASGAIAMKGETHPLQDAEGGEVLELLVKEGDHVTEGQILVKLDPAAATADLGAVDAQISAAKIRKSRLEAERDGRDFSDDEAKKLAANNAEQALSDEAALFRARRDAKSSAHERLQQQRQQVNDQIVNLTSQKATLDHQAQLLDQEIDSLEKLYAKGLVPLTRLNETKRARADIDKQMADNLAGLASAKSKLSEIEQQDAQAEHQFMSESLADLRETATNLENLGQKHAAATARLDGRTVHAPIAGTVSGLAIDGKGSAVAAGKTMMSIVPEANGLIVDGQFSPQMRDQVHEGAKCSVRLLSLDSRTTKRVPCTVDVVGAAAEADPRTGAPFFKLRARVDPADVADLGDVTLAPGAPAEIFVETESRSLLGYLVDPLFRQFDRALLEH